MMDGLLEAVSVAAYVFGALTFAALALFYWGEQRREKRGARTVLPVFTLVCAIAFLTNLLSEATFAQSAPAGLGGILLVAGSLALGLIPPLMLHLIIENEGEQGGGRWRWVLRAFYAGSLAIAAGRIVEGAGDLGAGWSSVLDRAPAISLAAAAALGLIFSLLTFSRTQRRSSRPGERAQWRWSGLLLALMLVCAIASLRLSGAYVDLIADYLLLAFFCVCLYYRERLVFFDVLLKRGVFLVLGLGVLIVAAAATHSLAAFHDFAVPWLYGFIFLWLAAPFIYARVARAIDRVWLRRPYSLVDAEREFIRNVQSAVTEEELHTAAARSLGAIFQTRAEVRFTGTNAELEPVDIESGLCIHIESSVSRQGFVSLAPRPNGVPFLSDDRRLLQQVAHTLGMVLENLRFRAERRRGEQREQQLQVLASRAELKALRAQINPHFLFNALSAIAGLMQYQPDLAEETIERLAQMFRYTLRKSDNEWTPLGEEIEFVTAYLRIEEARFGERLRVEFDIDPAATPVPIPAMSIQPLVENAIRHGVSAREGAGIVAVRAALEEDALWIEVSDNGPGFPAGFSPDPSGDESGASHGLRNIAERLHRYYGESGRLSCASDGNRTRVSLRIPQATVSAAAVMGECR